MPHKNITVAFFAGRLPRILINPTKDAISLVEQSAERVVPNADISEVYGLQPSAWDMPPIGDNVIRPKPGFMGNKRKAEFNPLVINTVRELNEVAPEKVVERVVEVIKEVPVPVIVEKRVPVETIKEVIREVEVIKPVQVIKEVEVERLVKSVEYRIPKYMILLCAVELLAIIALLIK